MILTLSFLNLTSKSVLNIYEERIYLIFIILDSSFLKPLKNNFFNLIIKILTFNAFRAKFQ